MKTEVKRTSDCCGDTATLAAYPPDSGAGCCPPSDDSGPAQRGGDAACCDTRGPLQPAHDPHTGERHLEIDFLYLDLSVCTRCQGADSSLDEAIAEVGRVLEATGVKVHLRKVQITSEAQAAALGFVVSPTIRVNGRDIQMNFRESLCESCGTLCDCEQGVSCREWEHRGQWHLVPPQGLIIEAMLTAVFGAAGEGAENPIRDESVPDNLKRYFDSHHHR